MKTSSIINDDMTLEEKLVAIDKAIAEMQAQASEEVASEGASAEPFDLTNLMICEGCQ